MQVNFDQEPINVPDDRTIPLEIVLWDDPELNYW